jgi:hypothetical protein
MPWEGGEAIQLTQNGGDRPLESSDGRYVYYFKSSGQQPWVGTIWRVPVNGGAEEEVLSEEVIVPHWDILKDRLYFGKAKSGEWFSIHFLDLKTEKKVDLFKQEGPQYQRSSAETGSQSRAH